MSDNLENTNRGLNVLDRILAWIDKYSFWDMVKAITLLLVLAFVIGFINNPVLYFEYFQKVYNEEHERNMIKAEEKGKRLNELSEKILIETDADRVCVLSLHNGNNSVGKIPYRKFTMIIEKFKENVLPVSDYYKDVQLSLHPFFDKLAKDNGYFYGNVEKIQSYDRSLSYKILSNKTNYMMAVGLYGKDKDKLGVITISYSEKPRMSEHSIRKIVNEYLLDLQIEMVLE